MGDDVGVAPPFDPSVGVVLADLGVARGGRGVGSLGAVATARERGERDEHEHKGATKEADAHEVVTVARIVRCERPLV